MECPHCGHKMETAEYLETDDGFASAQVCMNPECWELLIEKDRFVEALASVQEHFEWTEQQVQENAAFLRKLSPELADKCLDDFKSQVAGRRDETLVKMVAPQWAWDTVLDCVRSMQAATSDAELQEAENAIQLLEG